MRARKVALFTVFLCCFFVGSSLAAVELTLFDKDFVRNRGKADTYTDSFIAHEHEARLIVRNGIENGRDRISSASIILNGEEIIRPQDLNQKVYQKEFTVDLLEENRISVELASKPGSYLSIEVVQEIDADAAAVIGIGGGTLKIKDAESSIFGSMVEVPPRALERDIILTMKQSKFNADLPENKLSAGPVVDFGPDGMTFLKKIKISMPYYDESNDGYLDGTLVPENELFVLSHNKYSSMWEYPTVVSYDKSNNILAFEDIHFSDKGCVAEDKPPIAMMTINYSTYVLNLEDHLYYTVQGKSGSHELSGMRLEVFKLNNGLHDELIIKTIFPRVNGRSEAEFKGSYSIDGKYNGCFNAGVYDCVLTVEDICGKISKYHKQIAVGLSRVNIDEDFILFDIAKMIDNGGKILNENIDFYNYDPPEINDSDCINFVSRAIIGGLYFTNEIGKTPLFDRFYQMDWLNTNCNNNWYNFATSTIYKPDIYGNGNICKNIDASFRFEFMKRISESYNYEKENAYISNSWKSVKDFKLYIENRKDSNEGLLGEVKKDNNIQLGDLLYNLSPHIVVVAGIEGEMNSKNIWNDNTSVRIYQHGNSKDNYNCHYKISQIKQLYGNPINFIRIKGYYLPDSSIVDDIVDQIDYNTLRFDSEYPQGQVAGIKAVYTEGTPVEFRAIGLDNLLLKDMHFQIAAIGGGIVYDSDYDAIPLWEVQGILSKFQDTVYNLNPGSYDYVLWVKDMSELTSQIRGNFRVDSIEEGSPPSTEKILTNVIISGDAELYEGSSVQYKARAVFSDGGEEDVTADADCEWYVYPEKYVEASESNKGFIKALPGSFGNEVTIQAKYNYGNISIAGRLKLIVK